MSAQTFMNFEITEHGKQVKFIDARYYTRDYEKWYPGVTTILNVLSKGKQFEQWLKSNGFNADVLTREAMERGSRVHQAIQDLLQGKELFFGTNEQGAYYSREEWVMINRFYDFFTEFKPVTVEVEKVLVSDELQFGSQLDYVCMLREERWLIDHKTGSLYDTAYMQTASYKYLWDEFFPNEPIQRVGILHLDSMHRGRDKSGKEIQGQGWKLIEVTDIERHWEDFKHLQAIWQRQNPDYKPFNVSYPAVLKLYDEPKIEAVEI